MKWRCSLQFGSLRHGSKQEIRRFTTVSLQANYPAVWIVVFPPGVGGHGGGDLPPPRPRRRVPHRLPPVVARPQDLQVCESRHAFDTFRPNAFLFPFGLNVLCLTSDPSPLGRSCWPMWRRGWARTWRTAAPTPSTPRSTRLRATWSVKTQWWWREVAV